MEGILKGFAGSAPLVKSAEKESDAEYARKLSDEISEIKHQLNEIENAFNLVVESELIEAYIYEQRSLKAKLNYLIRLAKEKNICYPELYNAKN